MQESNKSDYYRNLIPARASLDDGMVLKTRSSARFTFSSDDFLNLRSAINNNTFAKFLNLFLSSGSSAEKDDQKACEQILADVYKQPLDIIYNELKSVLSTQLFYNRIVYNNELNVHMGVSHHTYQSLGMQDMFNVETKPVLEQGLLARLKKLFNIYKVNFHLNIDESIASVGTFSIEIGESFRTNAANISHKLFIKSDTEKKEIASLYEDQSYFIIDAIKLTKCNEVIAASLMGSSCLDIYPQPLTAHLIDNVVHNLVWQDSNLIFTLGDKKGSEFVELTFEIVPVNNELAAPRIAMQHLQHAEKSSVSIATTDFVPLPMNNSKPLFDDLAEVMTLNEVIANNTTDEIDNAEYEAFTIDEEIATPLFKLKVIAVVAQGKKYLNKVGINEVIFDDDELLPCCGTQALEELGISKVITPDVDCSFSIYSTTHSFGRNDMRFTGHLAGLRGLDSKLVPNNLSRFAFSREQLVFKTVTPAHIDVTSANDKHAIYYTNKPEKTPFAPLSGSVRLEQGAQVLIGAYLFSLQHFDD